MKPPSVCSNVARAGRLRFDGSTELAEVKLTARA